MPPSMGEPHTVLNSLAVIDGAESLLTPSQVAERTIKSSGTMTATLDALEVTDEGQAGCSQFVLRQRTRKCNYEKHSL